MKTICALPTRAALHLRGDIDDLHRAADELGHLLGFQRLAAQLGQIVELAGEQNAALVLLAGGELFNRPAAAVEHDTVFGAEIMNWPQLGSILAIVVMGSAIITSLEKGK